MLSTDIGRNIELNMFYTGYYSKSQNTANLILSNRSLRTFPYFTFAYVLHKYKIPFTNRDHCKLLEKPFSYTFIKVTHLSTYETYRWALGSSFWTKVLKNIENWKQVTENDMLEIISQNLPWQSYGQEDVKMIIYIKKAQSLLSSQKDAINPFRLFKELYNRSAGKANGQDSLYCF
ncbi:1111_t:CDS:2 [Funneliformis mosseae]|uniref:1111_t:CDS:1 n=1 Tax=Funneliformis mosseae TaxID=27381 RepID=A0A9N8V6D2_FUNMO|nr:1111_t:CDS:2 [Funneliformis mosseae]